MQSNKAASNNNDKNIDFYNNIGVEPFKLMAEVGGFDSYKDLELCYDHIQFTQSVLELGAGYGRCIDFLIKKKYKGKIFAVEYSPVLVAHLEDEYKGVAQIIHGDIKTLQLPQKVDVALWMWSGFIDFTEEEQMQCIKNISNFINPLGRLIMDLPRFGVQTIAQHADKQHIHFETPFGNLDCFIPSDQNIQKYAESSGFKKIQKIDYVTTTEKERSLFILQK